MGKVLNSDELFDLIESIKDKIEKEIIRANRTGTISEILNKYNFEVEEDYAYCEPRIAKVLVIGQSSTTVDALKSVLKKYNIDKDRFEFVLEYKDAKNFPMNTLRFNSKYCDIFAGPIPHKTNGMGDCSSILAEIQNNQSEYPKLTKLMSSGELKITKNSFEDALLKSQLMKNFINS